MLEYPNEELVVNVAIFDEPTVDWKPLVGPDEEPTDFISCSILNVDDDAKVVDILFKFSANEKIVMHRHTSNYSTFTVQGELRVYNTDGSLKDVRPAGTYKAGTPGEAHTEGGGDEDVIALFSLRPYKETDPIYEILDDDMSVAAVMTFEDLKALHEEYSA